MEPIKLYLVAGFLGAGKTTFLQRLLAGLKDQRVGLLVNEFGSVGVDGALLREGEIKLVEINHGSIFCACLKDGFVRTLRAFAEQPIDLLLIENSGMADPGSMTAILEQLEPYLSRSYDYRGMVCLVDATTFSTYVDVLSPVQNQAALADLIIVNKTDLADADTLAETREKLRALNAQAAIYETTYAQVPYALIEHDLICHGKAGACSNTPWNRPATYQLTAGDLRAEVSQAQAFCAALSAQALRIKGFLQADQGWLHVEAVCDQIEISAIEETEDIRRLGGTLVIIGRTPEPFQTEVRQAWENVFHTPVKLEES